jgi:hypothetical protein
MATYTNETFEKQEDGTMILVKTEIVEIEEKTIEEQLAEKEAQMLEIYHQITELKAKLA